ncbi:hypothetical protein CK203_086525 [Vitis vinifera]|uniref:Uncharacterized protein n=1 Tax=Vitis vinifera TaxID=29760 RepID=A0A438EIE4_VITVI|nr:hypothetical protein CK203_086525 [Vitis vinifera]
MKGEVQLEPSGERNPRDSDPLLENQADSSTGSSSEINSEDIEAGSVPCCRICLECDGEPDKAGGMFEKPYAEWVFHTFMGKIDSFVTFILIDYG